MHINCWALDSQLKWLTDQSGQIAVNYIGKFEDLADSYLFVQRQIGLKEGKLPELLHSDSIDYRPAYSNTHRNLIAAKYAEEIEMFGYTFE